MTTITLEVPDELAARLNLLRDRLPALLSRVLDLLPLENPPTDLASEAPHPAFAEIIDFLATGPTPDQIVAFKASASVQARLEELLEKNREEGLTEAESAELDLYEQVNDLMILLKARARTTHS